MLAVVMVIRGIGDNAVGKRSYDGENKIKVLDGLGWSRSLESSKKDEGVTHY